MKRFRTVGWDNEGMKEMGTDRSRGLVAVKLRCRKAVRGSWNGSVQGHRELELAGLWSPGWD